MDNTTPPAPKSDMTAGYILDTQVGFLLRRATQRHLTIFSGLIPAITSTQFAALSKLCELGPTSQNALGRATAMDAATIKGVIDRLRKKGLITSRRDPDDQRRIFVAASEAGSALYHDTVQSAQKVSEETLSPLSKAEQTVFLEFLSRLT
ncbi:MarR family winged helix-turn-helix transcriptional regulator [Thalassovita taeanensis]|uniref:Transcriptional regulator, MarR family n=1 Tax=Thalassovita taeanensis TaxID=657014 RepID=A0A1H9AJ75_9RHOB|nr:MarR family transcriptional regulator [Thalassovita taeanensis]SEP76796.1 transcriptional regulator, MarR family [Thalassovita taeanensis]